MRLNKKRIWMMAASWVFVAGPVVGASLQPKMLGLEDSSCQAWAHSKDDPELRREYVSWIRGFLSGHNYANQKQPVSDVSRGTVEQYVERFCREKPHADVTEAASRMSDDYSGRGAPITK